MKFEERHWKNFEKEHGPALRLALQYLTEHEREKIPTNNLLKVNQVIDLINQCFNNAELDEYDKGIINISVEYNILDACIKVRVPKFWNLSGENKDICYKIIQIADSISHSGGSLLDEDMEIDDNFRIYIGDVFQI